MPARSVYMRTNSVIDNLKPFSPSQEQIEYIHHLHRSGNDIKVIAEHLDWSFWTVLNILNNQKD